MLQLRSPSLDTKSEYAFAGNPLAGLVAGAAAGLVAAWTMNAVQTLVPTKARGNPATVNAVDALSRTFTGKPVAKRDRTARANTLHYAFGALLGGAYGMAAETWPRLTSALGVPFGLAIAAIADEALVPAFGFAPPPWKSPAKLHAYGAASHMVFGAVTETVRKVLRPT